MSVRAPPRTRRLLHHRRHAGPLEGEVRVPGAKNSVLKLMAASLMADGVVRDHQRADDRRRRHHVELLAAIGVDDHQAARAMRTICNTGR